MQPLYNVNLTSEEWDFVVAALAKYPFEQVFGLISNISNQVELQKIPSKEE